MPNQWSISRCLISILGFDTLVWGWTVTRYFEERVSTFSAYTLPTETLPEGLITNLITVSPTVDHPTAIETITTSLSQEPAIGYHQIVLESGQAQVVSPDPDDLTIVDYHYFVALTHTKPTDCTYSFSAPTSTQTAELYLPDAASDAVVATSTTATTEVIIVRATERRTLVDIDAYLDAAQVPPEILDSVEGRLYPYSSCETYRYDGDGDFYGCDKYAWRIFQDIEFGGGYRCSNGEFHTWGLQPWSLAVVVVFTWMGFFLFVGVGQSIVQFRNLMRGYGTKRGLPGGFCCLIPVLAAPLLYFHKKGFACRSEEDRAVLSAQWNSMPLSEKVRLYVRYGFTAEYPPVLGPSPGPPRARPNPSGRRRPRTDSQEEYEPGPPPYTRNVTPPPRLSDQHGDAPSGNVPADQPPKYSEDESR